MRSVPGRERNGSSNEAKVDRIDELIEAGEWATALELANASTDDAVHVARLVWHSSRPTECSPATLKRAYHALLGTTYDQEDARLVVAGGIRLATELGTTPGLAHSAIDLALNAVQLSVQQQGRNETTARARRTLLEFKDRVSTYEALYAVAAAPGQDHAPATPRIRHGRTFSVAAPPPSSQEATTTGEAEDAEGWGEIDLPSEEPPTEEETDADPTELPPPPSLSTFLATPLVLSALSLASLAALPELCLLCSLHPTLLWPARSDILDAIPLWVDPQAYVDLLPVIELAADDDVQRGQEAKEKEREGWAEAQPWRAEPDWSESPPYLSSQAEEEEDAPSARPRTASAVREWYLARVSAHVAAGFIDEALSLIQHGAARNVTGLEETGEDVSLLARLVHDRPPLPPTSEDDRPWTLERWRSLEPKEVIEAYTATCTPQDLAPTIKSLVMPYLHVLQARTERRRQRRRRRSRTTPAAAEVEHDSVADDDEDDRAAPERSPTEHLYDYILSLPRRLPRARSAPSGLELFLAIVEASIPTLPPSRRLVSSDLDLARLAIAALYGAGSAGATNRAAVVMSRVFECLPAFESPSPSPSPPPPPPPQSRLDNDHASSSDGDDADLFSLAAAHNNKSKGSAPPSAAPPPAEIFRALSSASPAALSAHLDTLDLHLSQLETFLRYSSPPSTSGLAWFLASYRDRAAQLQWATRLARTASIGGGEDGGEFESEDEWVGLMEFMADATGVAPQPTEGGDGAGDSSIMDREEAIRKGLGRAFCLLERDEVLRIFFGGLLAAGRFALARSLFDPTPSTSLATPPPPPLSPPVVEELVISASREFYDNAESGNLHSGDMKLALECLSAAPQQTSAIRRERDFIEATSKLCSYRLDSRPGIALTPIELRHAPDRLTFIGRLLSANPQVAKHPDMVLELARKLVAEKWSGASEVRVLTMLSEASTAAGDWNLASEMCGRTVRAVEALRKRSSRSSSGAAPTEQAEDADAAAEQAWRACFQLGKHEGWTSDPRKKLDALGQALTLCPPERIQDILPVWNKLELQVAQEALLSEKEKEEAKSAGRRTRGEAAPGAAHAAEAAARAAASAAAGATAAGAARVAGFLAAAAARGAANVASGSASNPSSSSSSAANTPTSPRSFTPLQQASRLASPTSVTHAGASASHLAHETAAAASHTLRRAAAFFGGGGGATGGPTMRPESASPSRNSIRSSTPTTPPRSPARGPANIKLDPAPPPRNAGSRFAAALGGLTDPVARDSSIPTSPPRGVNLSPARHAAAGPPAAAAGVTGFGLRAGLSNTLTAGVGWLIGADEMLEDERRRREQEEAQAQERERTRRAAEQDRTRLVPVHGKIRPPGASAPISTPRASSPTTQAASRPPASGGVATLAPYASSYVPPRDVPVRSGPVAVTLALGPDDETDVDELMDIDVKPAQEDVLAAVQSIRQQDGVARMELDFPERVEAPACAFSVAVVDTNILISHLALLRTFVRLAEELPLSNRPLLFIPQIVLTELDGLKTSNRPANFTDSDHAPSRSSISTLARSAIGWLLNEMSSGSPVLRGQKRTETLLRPLDGSRIAEDNDTLVLDAALWCRDRRVAQNVVLLTDDRNLQLRGTVEGLHARGVAGQRNADELVAVLSQASADRTACEESPKTPAPRTSRHAPSPSSRGSKPTSPRLRQRDAPSYLDWQSRTSVLPVSARPSHDPAYGAIESGGHHLGDENGHPVRPEHDMADESGDNGVLVPPLHANLPPPPTVSVEDVTDVFYNIALLVAHFVALPIYRHIYQYLDRTRPSERQEWLAELGDWRNWHPEDCVSRARTYWETGDIQNLCQRGLDYAYAAQVAAPVVPPSRPVPPPSRSPRANGASKWSMSTAASTSAPTGTQRTRISPSIAPLSLQPRLRTPKLAHVYRDLPLVRDFLAAKPSAIPSWSAPRWEVVIETTGLLLVAVLGGTFDADVRRDVDEIVRAWVADLKTCGIEIGVQM